MDNRSLKRIIIGLFIGFGFLFSMSLAHAQSLPSSGSWTSTGPGTRSVTDVTYGVQLNYNYQDTSIWNNGETWEYSTTASEAADIYYTWTYSGNHAWYQASASVTAFVEHSGTQLQSTPLFDQTVFGGFYTSGVNSFHVNSGDTYGFKIYGKNFDSSDFLNGSLKIETAPRVEPTVTGTSGNNGWYISDAALNWSVTDPASGVPSTSGCNSVTLTSDTTVTGATYTCTATSADGTSSKSVTLKRDTAAPTTTDDAPGGWVDSSLDVHLTASDGASGIAATYYTVDGGAALTGKVVHFATEGSHSLTYWSVDQAGNVELQHASTVRIDKTAPDVPTVTQSTYGPAREVIVSIAYSSDTVVKTYQLGSGEPIVYTGPFVVTANTTVTAYATDEAGNMSQSIVAINNIDRTAPIITLEMYDATTPTNRDITVTVATYDATLNATSHTFKENGSFEFIATDAAGNTASLTVTIANIDKTLPATTDQVTIDKATNDVTVELSASDNRTDPLTSYYTVDGVEHDGHSILLKKQGIHRITYWSVDAAGNVEAAKSKEIQVQLLPLDPDGQFHIEGIIQLIRNGTLLKQDMNDDGLFDGEDIKIMLEALTPIIGNSAE